MQIFKIDILGKVITKAITKNGVSITVKIEGKKITEEIYVKGKRYQKGSYLFSFKFDLPFNKSSKLTPENLIECFSDISNIRKEFKNNVVVNKENSYCQIWIDNDEDSIRNAIKIILNLKYDLRDWEITNISK